MRTRILTAKPLEPWGGCQDIEVQEPPDKTEASVPPQRGDLLEGNHSCRPSVPGPATFLKETLLEGSRKYSPDISPGHIIDEKYDYHSGHNSDGAARGSTMLRRSTESHLAWRLPFRRGSQYKKWRPFRSGATPISSTSRRPMITEGDGECIFDIHRRTLFWKVVIHDRLFKLPHFTL